MLTTGMNRPTFKSGTKSCSLATFTHLSSIELGMNQSTFRSGTKSYVVLTFTYLLSIKRHLRHWVLEFLWGILFRLSSWLFFRLNRPLYLLPYTFAKQIQYSWLVSYTRSTMQSRAEHKKSGHPNINSCDILQRN